MDSLKSFFFFFAFRRNRRWVPLAEVELAPLITYLINKSITDGTVPALWKVACEQALLSGQAK